MDRVQTATSLYQALAPTIQMGPIPQNIPSLQLSKAFLSTINEPAAFEFLNLVNTMLEQAQGGMQQQYPPELGPQMVPEEQLQPIEEV
jgi:hypothetical protein